MAGVFSATAIAIASHRANAVGAVRLTCAREGLEVELLRVASFAAGFAPAGVVEAVRFRVPYTAVRGLVRQGKTLCVALDPAAATPYNRFALVRFSDDPSEALVSVYQARARARLLGLVLPVPAGVLAAVCAPRELVSGVLGLLAVGLIAAGAVWLALREVVAWLSWGGPISDRYRDALEMELSRRLGLAPARVAVDPYGEPSLDEPIADGPAPASPRLRLAVVLGVVVASVVGAMAFLKRFAEPGEAPPPRVALLQRGVAAAASRAAIPAGAELGTRRPRLPRCLCDRPASPLWNEGLPVMSVLLSSRYSGADGEARGTVSPRAGPNGKMRYDFDLSVVNNGAESLHDIKVVVTFARRSPEGERVGIKERGLFWEGELRPGRAVKWRVRAPGTEFRIDTAALGSLAERGAAPPDAFFELTAARQAVVRAHAAMMLAYVRDPRAIEAAQGLNLASSADELFRARIARAAEPLTACDIQGGSVCVFNGTSAPVEGAELHEVVEPGPEDPRTPRTWTVEGTLPVHEGIRVPLAITGQPPTGGAGVFPPMNARPPSEIRVRAMSP